MGGSEATRNGATSTEYSFSLPTVPESMDKGQTSVTDRFQAKRDEQDCVGSGLQLVPSDDLRQPAPAAGHGRESVPGERRVRFP
jgi:hypothetical protein